ncbi:MAG: sterol desaturase family protein [Planctomycetota bacterium]|nr:MAG: sterol desaturase family protein [Planctomycetota bacterium]
METKKVPAWLSGLLVGGAFLALVWLERRRPLRRPVEPKGRHDVRNLAIAGLSAAAVQVVENPVTQPLAALVEQRRWGLLKTLRLPGWLEIPLAVVLQDYLLYVWHILVHKVPFLWRFHLVHHVDLDLDASTALRFRLGEMVLSVPWRAAQVVLIGVSPLALSVWQTATLVEILFHHSNVELPMEVERLLSRLVVTPRIHGIHHSIIPEETCSNWSSGLTLWDRLHGTQRTDVPQEEITTLPKVLAMPFKEQRDSWRLPDDGRPSRAALHAQLRSS